MKYEVIKTWAAWDSRQQQVVAVCSSMAIAEQIARLLHEDQVIPWNGYKVRRVQE